MRRLLLKPSHVEGIGVFTNCSIPKGTDIEQFFKIPNDAVLRKSVTDPMEKRYCVKYDEGWWCPIDFHQMSVWWFLNHSATPNISVQTKQSGYRAIRDIKRGEELTINYKHLNSQHFNIS